ncbi:MAG: ATP-binding cassette domain-containing protein [Alphaproteobacteria bacterium]|jgi:zinc transport system ATP-binding protein|nr:ATP-binding cassette domain-containing protein [Alphaproteobacteria bacterium]
MNVPTQPDAPGAAPGQIRDQAALVAAEGLAMSYQGRQILSGVDLTVNRGEIVTLIGLNGSGKSTLARILLGLIQPEAGRVWRAAHLRHGYVPQEMTIDPAMPLTLQRFLTLGGKVDGAGLDATLDEVGLQGRLQAQVARLSGGELHRAMLARALLRRPDFLVLDEPMSGVDVAGQGALYQLIENVRDRYNCGVLLISHDLHIVMAATDRVICLNHHVCCTGRPDSVVGDPEFRALFGAAAADRLALYQHHHDHSHDAEGGIVPLDHDHDHDHGHAHD